MPSATYRKDCFASRENAMSETDPSRTVFGNTATSFTNDPSFLKICMRSFARSQTYTMPSLLTSAHITAENCCDGVAPGAYAGVVASVAVLPYAPHERLIAPVFMSITATR